MESDDESTVFVLVVAAIVVKWVFSVLWGCHSKANSSQLSGEALRGEADKQCQRAPHFTIIYTANASSAPRLKYCGRLLGYILLHQY